MLVQTGTGVFRTNPRAPLPGETCWIHLAQPEAEEVENLLGDILELHPLAVEDVQHFGQRAKVDVYDHWARPHALVSFYSLTEKLDTVELSLIIGTNFIVSVTEQPVSWLEEMYRRAEAAGFSFENPTSVLYRILDGCVDIFGDQLDDLDGRLERMQRRVFRRPDEEIASTVFQIKRRLHQLRKIALDELATVSSFKAETMPFVDRHFEVYFQDINDHIARTIDNIELVRDGFGALLDFQAMQRSAKMNEVMKTLTIISTIFLPLSFIVGLYGMNFHDMPELSWRFGYLYVWILMIAVTVFFIIYFKWKKWW